MDEFVSSDELAELEDVLREMPLDRPGGAAASLRRADLDDDPLVTFARWIRSARETEQHPPNAMTLATADDSGRVSARVVLLKRVTSAGFLFFTNLESRKGRELEVNPNAALVFYWPAAQRQVRVTGSAERASEDESKAYFDGRPRSKRIAAWASRQSETLASRADLDRLVAETERRFPGDAIPLPPHWGGVWVRPREIEFWQGHPDRLHDRFSYTRVEAGWSVVRLSP